MNSTLSGFRCTTCARTYAADDPQATYTCPADGGNLDAVYDYAAIRRSVDPRALTASPDRSVWHYAPLLPCALPPDASRLPTPLTLAGWSPLYRATRLEAAHDIRRVWLKDDARLPSSSFKDRASAQVIARGLELGVQTVCAASTGNAASSLVTLCAGGPLRCVIFVPQSTPEGKLAQILIHGARVYAVQGSYDDAFELALQASRAFGWYNRNTGVNPFTREGKKTAAFEIAEQLGAATAPFRAPDVLVVPVGDGNIISGIHKGFKDLHALGWIERVPRFIGVTATLAPALYRAWESGSEQIDTVPSRTLASGISVDLPRDGIMALRAVRETGGCLVEASDDEMLDAMRTLAREAAVFTEPASAAGLVGLRKARALGAIRADDEVVIQLTGSGLKDVRSALQAADAARQVVRIEGRLDEVKG
jgi:threonine synthase